MLETGSALERIVAHVEYRLTQEKKPPKRPLVPILVFNGDRKALGNFSLSTPPVFRGWYNWSSKRLQNALRR